MGRNVRSSAATKLLTLKATIAEDERLLEDGTSQEKLNRGLEMFQEIVTSIDPQDVAKPARKGVGRMPIDIAYSTIFNRYMIFVLGQYAEFSTAGSIYEAYRSSLPASRTGEVPLDMLRAIMDTKLGEGDHETVRMCWEASLAQAKRIATPIKAKSGHLPEDHLIRNERKAIAPARQLDLARHLGTYLQSLHTQRKTDEMIATVDGLLSDGFALDNHNWNSYLEFLAIRQIPARVSTLRRQFDGPLDWLGTHPMDSSRAQPSPDRPSGEEERSSTLTTKVSHYLALGKGVPRASIHGS